MNNPIPLSERSVSPMMRINSMSTTGEINAHVLSLILTSKYVDQETKQYIVRTVNCHEQLVRALKAVRVLLIDDEIFATTKELQKTINAALRSAEGE